MTDEVLGLGLIGCGSFGLFCMEAYAQMHGVRIAAVADINAAAADRAADRFGAVAHCEPADLIRREDVHIVHIATPPASHHKLVMAALAAGKDVLCEKPLAMDLRQADEMLSAAVAAGLIAPVNFVLRYNAVSDMVKAIVDSGLLGRALAGRVTNCAFDTFLPPEHWFWDKSVSGGIFIEHGVHFFDLYRHWLGPGSVISAHTETRERTGQEDRVTCTVRHSNGAVVSHYHGFDQTKPMDRTDHRLVFELGDVFVDGWIPLSLKVDAAVDDEGAERLAGLLPGCEINTLAKYDERRSLTSGRGRERRVTRRVMVKHTPQSDKQAVYSASASALLADQIARIRDPAHTRRVTEQDGRDSLALAEAATILAGQ